MDFEGAFIDVEDYELTKKKLGEGSFGVVYVVNCLKDHVQYAAKIIPPDKLSKGNEQMMLIRESGILHKLHHPAIVKFCGINFHSFEDPSLLSPTIITEYLENGSLSNILKQSRIKPNKQWTPTKKYISLLGISDAMRYLHEQSILHRDLKPENVLIDHDYYPRVCDFGLSKCFYQGLTPTMQVTMTANIGSPLYMAPELFNDDDEAHHFTTGIDVYAFSILTYQIVTEKVPFMKDGKYPSFFKLANMVNSGNRPEITSDVTPKMKNLLNRCWSATPKDRPSFGEIFDLLSSDFSYIKEEVDQEEVQSYISKLKEARKNCASPMNKKEKSPKKKSEEVVVPFSDLLIDISDVKKEDEIGSYYRSKVYKATIKNRKVPPETEYAMKTYEHANPFFNNIEYQHLMKHVSILPLVGFAVPSESNDFFTIFTPFMENRTLDDLLKKINTGNAPENWESIKYICVFGIAAGMAYIHQHNVVHRNLKPSNIFLDKNYYPKIGDFSISTFCNDDTVLQDWCGTPIYMAPEVLFENEYSNKADVYSYSIVLYQLITGDCRIYDCNLRELKKKVEQGERPKIRDGETTPAFENLIKACWSQNPNDRPSFIQIVKKFIDNKDEFFDMTFVDEEEIEIYIEDAIQGLDFSLA